MVVVLCSVCGEPGDADTHACPVCDARDQRAVPKTSVPATPTERLLANIKRTVATLSDLRTTRPEELRTGAKAARARALKRRLEAQSAVLRARLGGEHEGRNAAAYRDALDRVERELAASL